MRTLHVGRHLATLFLDEYKLSSLEDVTSLFGDKWMRESLQKTIERLDAITALFEAIKAVSYTHLTLPTILLV